QLAAGMTTFHPERNQLIDTHKDVGTVTEVFHLNHEVQFESLMEEYAGRAAIGHVRYATCGKDDKSYAQPFERHHIEKSKWFSFGFNGQLANYPELREEVLAQKDFHLTRETDTEILMHSICQEFSGDKKPQLIDVLRRLAQKFDGAYNIVYLNAQGDMFVSRDPLGIRPLCYAIQGPLFAAASESVALDNIGFDPANIKSLPPGHAIIIQDGQLSIQQYAPSPRRAHCFFEWIYFANVASTLDDRSVYLTRKRLGEELARLETLSIDVDRANTIVVPVPDTAKAAADSMAFQLGVPSLEGLIRNRYIGRTFIESGNRANKARMKYTPLREVLEGKRVLLVEDTIVRSTTMKALISQLRDRGRAKEVHVRVACPPIIAPCFYGIDMSTVDELFAPKFMHGGPLTPEIEQEMAEALGADSLRYLPQESIARCVGITPDMLCQACLDGDYPTDAGKKLYEIALDNVGHTQTGGRTYDAPEPIGAVRT
ncbi:MAG TPA: phosphoribosyltransferase family protein, partial [Planctomycetaceae bacterium]|nr:phosphoribosyltransferase family protein [Planctomycetaceae bacterium]